MSEKPIIIFKCTENGISILGVKRRGVKRRQTKTLFYHLYVYKEHTANTGCIKAEGKRAGVKGGGGGG